MHKFSVTSVKVKNWSSWNSFAVSHRNRVLFGQERLKVSPQNCDDEGHVFSCWYGYGPGQQQRLAHRLITGHTQSLTHSEQARIAPGQLQNSQHEYKYL